jgi:pimeloyl-ACP methyl ester carboxylesterase
MRKVFRYPNNPMPARAQAGNLPRQAQDQFLQLEGTRLRYRDEGAGQPIVLVHGWTLDLEMWDPQVARLRDGFRLVRLDRRGHGSSTGSPSAERDASDLDFLCRHLGLEDVSLIGMSQGARGVLAFAGAASARIRALVLDGVPTLESPISEEDVPLSHYRSLIHSQGIEAFRREWERHPLMQLRTQDGAARELLRTMVQRYSGRDLIAPVCDPGVAERLPLASVRAPTLLLNGEFDLPSRLASSIYLTERLPRAERICIAGAGHLPNLDEPDVYSELCRSFLTRHLPTPAAY